MKNKKLLVVLTGLLALTGCRENPSVQPTPTPTPTTPAESTPEAVFAPVALDVVKTYKNNDAVQAEGIVYGVTKNGFFFTDTNSAGIFVNMGDDWAATVKIGSKVQVDAKFSLVSGYSMLKQATVKVVAENQEVPVTAAEKSFSFVNDLVASASGDYGMLVKLVGILSTVGGSYVLTSDSGETLNFNSVSAAHLATFDGKRITLEAIVYKTDAQNNWQLVFAGDESDIVDSTLTFADYVELAKTELAAAIPATCTGNLRLPQAHSVESSLTYTWAVKSGSSITIVENQAVVVPPTTDEDVVLTVTIAKGEETQTVDYTIKSKAVVEQTVAQFMSQLPLSGDAVKVNGIVVAMGRNQGNQSEPFDATKRYVVIQDATTTDAVPVNYYYSSTDHGFEGLSVGDNVWVKGNWSNENGNTDNPVINATSVELVSEGAAYADPKATAVVIDEAADYEDVAKNPNNYTGKLLKFANPYLAYSTTSAPTPSNWVRFGADVTVSKYASRSLATLIGLENENIEMGWDKHFNIANSGQDGTLFAGDIYAYLVYRSGDYLQLCIPSASYINLTDANANAAYQAAMALQTSVDSDGQLALPAIEGVTYTFDDGVEGSEIIAADGKVGTALKNMEVTVTVTKGEASFTKKVTVISATTYGLTVGTETNGTTTLSKSAELLQNEEVTATFTPAEGYVTLSYTVTCGENSVTYPAYNKTNATFKVPGDATVTANYAAKESLTSFNMSPSTNAVLWYNKDGNNAWTSGTNGTTDRDYDYVIERIKDADGKPINREIFEFSGEGLNSGKLMNLKASSSDYEGNFLCIYGTDNDPTDNSVITLTSKHEIYSINVTYVNASHYTRATVYAGSEVADGVQLEGSSYSYLVNGNSFSIENASGKQYLYIRNIEIIYAAPSVHEVVSDADGHWVEQCPSCDHVVAKEAHVYTKGVYEKDENGHSKVCDVCEYVAAAETHTYSEGVCECGQLEPVAGVTYLTQTITANYTNPTSKLLYANENGEWVVSDSVIDETALSKYACDSTGAAYNTELFDIKPIANASTGKVLNFSYKGTAYEQRVTQIQPTAGIIIECEQKIAKVVITYATNSSVDNSTRGLIKAGDTEVTGTQVEGATYEYTINGNVVTIQCNSSKDSLFIYSIDIVYEAPAAE